MADDSERGQSSQVDRGGQQVEVGGDFGQSVDAAWTPLDQIASGVQGGAPGEQIHFADLNADGKADYLNIRPNTSVIGYLNGGPP